MPINQPNLIRTTVERPAGALALLEEALNTAVNTLLERITRDREELIDQEDALAEMRIGGKVLHLLKLQNQCLPLS